jgi:hypothetical protein
MGTAEEAGSAVECSHLLPLQEEDRGRIWLRHAGLLPVLLYVITTSGRLSDATTCRRWAMRSWDGQRLL